MQSEIKVTAFQKSLQAYGQKLQAAATQALYQFCEFLKGLSQELCPYRYGFLRDSAAVGDVEVVDGHFLQCKITYNTDYAVFVHENLEAHHAPPTQAKYLEQPMRENESKMMPFIIEKLKL